MGPGSGRAEGLRGDCACKLEWVAVEDGAALLSRLQLEGKNTKADIVLGLDTNLTAEADGDRPVRAAWLDLSDLKLPIAWSDPVFVPFDYGYFAFVYDKPKLAEAAEEPRRNCRRAIPARRS